MKTLVTILSFVLLAFLTATGKELPIEGLWATQGEKGRYVRFDKDNDKVVLTAGIKEGVLTTEDSLNSVKQGVAEFDNQVRGDRFTTYWIVYKAQEELTILIWEPGRNFGIDRFEIEFPSPEKMIWRGNLNGKKRELTFIRNEQAQEQKK